MTVKKDHLLHIKINQDRHVVRRTPEVRELLRVTDRSGIIVPNHIRKDNAVVQRTGAIHIVDTGDNLLGKDNWKGYLFIITLIILFFSISLR